METGHRSFNNAPATCQEFMERREEVCSQKKIENLQEQLKFINPEYKWF